MFKHEKNSHEVSFYFKQYFLSLAVITIQSMMEFTEILPEDGRFDLTFLHSTLRLLVACLHVGLVGGSQMGVTWRPG